MAYTYDQDKSLLEDPIQGYDVQVLSSVAMGNGSMLVGRFTSVMFKVVNQTETYLPLNQRIARQLDGEILFVWAAEQGFIHPQFLATTFGGGMASGFGGANDTANDGTGVGGRAAKINRSVRFNLDFSVDLTKDRTNGANHEAQFYNTNFGNTAGFSLKMCRVDTYSFGVTAGRSVVANSWQGTAEQLKIM